MKKKKNLYGGLILLVVAVGIGWYFLSKKKNGRGEQSQVVQVARGPIERAVEATGEVAPLNRVEIKPPISGRVEKILVDEGQHVKAGDILAWLSSSDRAAILDAARAHGPEAVKEWEDTYKPTPIMAPLSGVIILRNAIVGQTVDAGTVLFAMSDKLIVLTHVDEVDIGHVKVDMPATITLDAYPGMPVPGHVSHILYEGTNVSNVITYGVKVEPDQVPPYFRSQMTANVHLIMSREDDALLVPAAAVKARGEDGKFVLIPSSEGKPQQRPVETGIESGDKVQIVSGLSEGDSVLIVKRRYTPQQAQGSNPLMMGQRRSGSQQGSGSGSRGGSGGNRGG